MKKTNFKNFLKMSQGINLTEILVTIAIIIILSGLVIAKSGSGQSQLALSRSANKLAQDLRKAQEMAMSAKECPTGTGCAGQVPPYYGIELSINDNDSYFIFADLNDEFGNPGGNGKYEPSDEIVETINIEKGIKIKELLTIGSSGSEVASNNIWITFKPPDPLTKVRNPAEDRLTARIILESGVGTREVFVNQSGLISVE